MQLNNTASIIQTFVPIIFIFLFNVPIFDLFKKEDFETLYRISYSKWFFWPLQKSDERAELFSGDNQAARAA